MLIGELVHGFSIFWSDRYKTMGMYIFLSTKSMDYPDGPGPWTSIMDKGWTGLVHFTDPQSMDYHEWTTEMDYLNGQLNGLPKWNTLNCLS